MECHRKQPDTAKGHLRRLGLGVATLAMASAGLLGAAVPAGASGAVTVKLVSHSGLGKILVNRAGMTVYIFTSDAPNKSACTGGCLAVWPAVTVPKGTKPKGGPGVKGLGTISSGGKLQVTWDKHPLYTYALDSAPGVVNGNNVKEGSGVWYAATSKVVTTGAAKSSTGANGSSGGSTGGYGY